MRPISRLLIANRGEIALRIIRACKELGIQTVLAVSEADRESLPARAADRAVCIGPPRALDSYLKIDTLIAAAMGTGADAIHPGYGFLAEQPELPEACDRFGLIFIGPSAQSIRQMGNKLLARKIAQACRIPTIPGSDCVRDVQEALREADRMGFPVLIKASAGGGGRGILVARNGDDLKSSFQTLSAEAYAAFGDGSLYLEHYVTNARHVEVQILGDQDGHLIHLFERDCTLQRRYQKIIEEAPSPAVPLELRGKICAAAVAIGRSVKYENAGTVEFVLDQDSGQFYFLEMNTRIQVEHPVTEQLTGVDIVREQIHIANSRPLGYTQEDIHVGGHAIECRINAEAPWAGFRPCAGRIKDWLPPQGAWIRTDSHCYPGYTVPPYYDSLLAKLITTGTDRGDALQRMENALKNFFVSGVETTIPFLHLVLHDEDYIRGRIHTRWLEDVFLKREKRHE